MLWVYENELSFDLRRAQLEVRRVELLLAQARNTGDSDQIGLQEVALELAQLNLSQVESRVDPSLEQAVARAQLAVAALERKVEERRIRAPFSGQVVAVGINLNSMRGPLELPHTPRRRTRLLPLCGHREPQPVELIVPPARALA